MPAHVQWTAGTDTGDFELRHAPEPDPNFRLDLESFYQNLQGLHKPLAVDLIRIGSHIYVADTSVARGTDIDIWGERWSRSFDFSIPIMEPDRWSSVKVGALLSECLKFLTGDDCRFAFTPWQQEARQGYLGLFRAATDLVPAGSVCLTSGGIDSLAAAVALSEAGKQPLLISHRSGQKLLGRRRELIQELRARTGYAYPHWSVEITRQGKEAVERSQRSRAFLYACLGMAAALSVGVDDVCLSDNGIASFNVLYSKATAGSEATRSTHPDFISLFNDLMAALTDSPPKLRNSLLYSTRVEVVRSLQEHDLQDLLALTTSCARPHMTTVAEPHCGTCSQCVDRRFAVEALGLTMHDTKYARDAFTDPLAPGHDTLVVEEYVRSASEITRMSPDGFILTYPVPTRFDPAESIEDQLRNIWKLHRRHAETVLEVLGNKLKTFSNELASGSLPKNCLLRVIPAGRPNRVDAAAAAITEVLRDGLPKVLAEAPKNERQVQNAVHGILSAYQALFQREHPAVRFLGKNFVPDFAPQLEELVVEVKYPTKTRPATRIREEMAADLTAYRANAKAVLFIIYDHHRLVLDEAGLRDELGKLRDPPAFVAVIR